MFDSKPRQQRVRILGADEHQEQDDEQVDQGNRTDVDAGRHWDRRRKDKGAAAADKPLKGKIVSVTPEKDKPETLDIVVSTGGKQNAHEVTIMADAGMKVSIDGADKKASDLAAGEYVTVTPATGTPTSIEATTGHKKKGDAK